MQTPYLFNTPADKLPNLMTTKQLADYTGYGLSTLYHWRLDGKGPKATRICGRVYYSKDEVLRFFNSCEQSA